jgi:hypothetical protein
MRCLIKAAAIHKYGIGNHETKVDALRNLLKEKGAVGPSEWFQAMLAQGWISKRLISVCWTHYFRVRAVLSSLQLSALC